MKLYRDAGKVKFQQVSCGLRNEWYCHQFGNVVTMTTKQSYIQFEGENLVGSKMIEHQLDEQENKQTPERRRR
jgi:hypothetical protein